MKRFIWGIWGGGQEKRKLLEEIRDDDNMTYIRENLLCRIDREV